MATRTEPATTRAAGLTTGSAPFIEEARGRGDLFIRQPYELYSAENQETWRALYAAIAPKWGHFATEPFLAGLDRIALDPDHIPRLDDINGFLAPLSGFKARPVSGYVPAYVFFDCLRRREFPTTITIRDGARAGYLPEPDIFHDLAGHVPMHTHRVFADILVRFGEVARAAVLLARGIESAERRAHVLENVIKGMARFFWFTIEFGLMRGAASDFRVYGSGLLSSSDEIEHAVCSNDVERVPFDIDRVVNQPFEIDHFQPILFVVESFDALFASVGELERRVLAGELEEVAPGEPAVDPVDLESFLAETERS